MRKLIMCITAAAALALTNPAAASSAAAAPAATPVLAYTATSPAATLGPAPVQGARLEIDVDDGDDGAWYTSPLWLAIGAVALIAIIALVASGRRGGTTVVK